MGFMIGKEEKKRDKYERINNKMNWGSFDHHRMESLKERVE